MNPMHHASPAGSRRHPATRRAHSVALSLALAAGVVASSSASGADDPRAGARERAREAAVQSAGIDRALSREMPAPVATLPVFGEILWSRKELPFVAPGPHAGISGAGMAVIDGRIYLAGGFIPAGDETQDLSRRTSLQAHRYDPESDRWERLPDLPARREYTRAVALEGALFVLGGAIQSRPTMPSAEVFRLDLSRSPLQWESLPPMNVPRTHHSAGVLGSRLIAAGGNRYDIAENGYSPQTILGATETLDLAAAAKGWQTRAPIPGPPRGWSATSVLNGKLYMLGGVTWTPEKRERLREALCYDVEADRWMRLADPPMPISGWESDVYRDRYLILIGGAGTRWNDIPFVYDTKSNLWMRIASPLPPGAFYNDAGVCIIGDTIYVAGGEGPGGSHFNHFLAGRILPRPDVAVARLPLRDPALPDTDLPHPSPFPASSVNSR